MSQGPSSVQNLNRFVWRLFLRFRGRMIFFASCIAIGIALLFAINNLVHALNQSIASQAKELMTSDLSLSSSRPFSAEAEKTFTNLEKEGIRHTKLVQFSSMFRGLAKKKEGVLVVVKAIEKKYPFYGRLRIQPKKHQQELWKKDSCFISEELALQHKFAVGDKVKLGYAVLEIAGIIKNEPDQLFSDGIAPRVLISHKTLRKTKLVQFGSRIRYLHLFASQPGKPLSMSGVKALKKKLESKLKSPYIRVTAFTDAQPTLREVLKRMSLFFLFVSMVALLLGAIGMSASITAFLNEQLPTVGVLRCLGFGPKDITSLYHRLCLLIGLLGGVLGTLLGALLASWGQGLLKQFINLPVSFELHWLNLAEGMILACVLTVGLNYLTVWSLAKSPPKDILGGKIHQIRLPWWATTALILGLFGAFYLYSIVSSNSPEIATFFTLSLAGLIIGCLVCILLGLGGYSLLMGRIQGGDSFSFILRHGLRQIVRQKTRSLTYLLALTIGISLISSLNLLQHSFITELQGREGRSIPDLFLVDVQKDQQKGVLELLKQHGRLTADFNPLIRSRLTKINGKKLLLDKGKEQTLEERSRMRLLTREYNLTYKDVLNRSEKVVSGKFWKPGTTTPQISIEYRLARRIGVSVGDSLTFDILGRPIRAKITSIRRINWSSLLPNFFVILPTKVLGHAPQTLITSVILKNDKARRAFQSKLGRKYPNITSLHIAKILAKVQGILVFLVWGMKILAWICVFVGLIILAGTLSMGKNERRRKIALLRAMGSNKESLRKIDVVEFLSIGVLTSVIVLFFSWLLGFALSKQMNIQLHVGLSFFVEVILASILLPMIVGLFISRDSYKAGVMENLRGGL